MEALNPSSVPDEIRHNPFRVLGCLSSATTKERISNRNRLAAFARVGRQCAFPTDFDGLFGGIDRSPEAIERAEQALDLPEDRILHALFWFCRTCPVDDAALGQLRAGDTARAEEMWRKRRTFSSCINLSVLAACRGDVRSTLGFIVSLIRNETERTAFLSMLGLEAAHHDEAALLRIYLEALGGFFSWRSIHEAVVQGGSGADIAQVEEMAVTPSLRRLENAVAARDEACGLEGGRSLLRETKDDLDLVDGILAKGNLDRRMIHDKLAKRLTGAALKASNGARTDRAVQDECLDLVRCAVGLAEGETVLDECRAAERTIDGNRKLTGSGEDLGRLQEARDRFEDIGEPTMNDVAEYVGSIKDVLRRMAADCGEDAVRETASSCCAPAHNALIHIMNALQADTETAAKSVIDGSLKAAANAALLLIDRMLELPLTAEAEERLGSLKKSLEELKETIGSLQKGLWIERVKSWITALVFRFGVLLVIAFLFSLFK